MLSALPRRIAASYSAVMVADEPGPGVTHLAVNVCWALLRSHEVGRLAISVADRPEIFPINYIVDHGTVVFRTAEGTKLAGAIQRDVAFEADGYEPDTGEAWSVVVKGRGEEIARHELLDTADLPLSHGTLHRNNGSCGSCPTRSVAAGFAWSTAKPGEHHGRMRPGRHPNDRRGSASPSYPRPQLLVVALRSVRRSMSLRLTRQPGAVRENSVWLRTVMQLLDEGAVDLDASVRRYVPNCASPTVRQRTPSPSAISCSRPAGCPPSPVAQCWPRPRTGSVTDAVRELVGVELAAAPGTRWQYANANYVLAGLVVERTWGWPMADYLERRIYRPLGMTGSFAAIEPAARPAAGGGPSRAVLLVRPYSSCRPGRLRLVGAASVRVSDQWLILLVLITLLTATAAVRLTGLARLVPTPSRWAGRPAGGTHAVWPSPQQP